MNLRKCPLLELVDLIQILKEFRPSWNSCHREKCESKLDFFVANSVSC
jgi:hypothetical protein